MIALLLPIALWVLDRFEGEMAVMTDGRGQIVDVARSGLPVDARPGDGFARPGGPRVDRGQARWAEIRARRNRLLHLAPARTLVQGAAVKNRSDHRQDHYFHKAKREGFAARSIYKLEEIDRKHRILRKGQRVLDLGCAPGSWLQYAAGVIGPTGRLFGIDLKPVQVGLPPHVTVMQGDAFHTPVETMLGEGQRFDVVLSDMAPSTIGNPFTDHVRSVELCERVLAVADASLKVGGTVVCKSFEGEDTPKLAAAFRIRFSELKRLKPKGTRTESVELFFIGLGFKGPPTGDNAVASAPEAPQGV